MRGHATSRHMPHTPGTGTQRTPHTAQATTAHPAARLTSHFDATKHSTAAGRTLHHGDSPPAAAAQLNAETPIAAYAGGGSRKWDTEAAQQGSPFGGDGSGVPAELEQELHALRTARVEYEHATAAQVGVHARLKFELATAAEVGEASGSSISMPQPHTIQMGQASL